MYYRSGNVDAAAYQPGRCFVLTHHQVAARFCVKWHQGHHLKSIDVIAVGVSIPGSVQTLW